MPPTLYIKNALRIAELGLGDGTVYYQGDSTTVDQGGKTFALFNIVTMGDLPALIDDALNGHILYFPNSGNKYRIVDFVASTSIVTIWGVPDATDTGAYEVRRALVDNKALAVSPTHRLADGRRSLPWKSGAFPIIDIHLPNHIDDGGFEENTGGGKWVFVRVGGTTDTSSTNTVSPILGGQDIRLDLGDRTVVYLAQNLQRPMFKERKYRVLFKARFNGGPFNQGDFVARFIDTGNNARSELPGFENPSSGAVTTSDFQPLLTASNTWYWADVVMRGEDINGGFVKFGFLILNNAITVNLDEVHIFERVNVDSLIVFDHNSYHFWTIRGRYCAKDRTGVVTGIDESVLVTNQTILKDPYIHEFTGGIFPIYELENTTNSISQASEMLLCEKWVMPFDPITGFRPNQKKNKQTVFTARSGVQTRTRHFQERTRTGTFEALPDADLARYLSDWLPHHFDDDYPFAVRWSDGETPMLMINDDLEAGETYSNLLGDWRFKFKEVF